MTSLFASSPGAPPDGTAAAPGTPPGRDLPLTLGHRLILAFGVPVAVLMIAVTGFNLVGNLGRASFAVSRTLAIANGRLAFTVDGGDVNVSPGGTPAGASLVGRVYYSLIRPTLFLNPHDGRAGGAASVRLGCPFLSMANCGINANLGVSAGTALTASTGGGNVTVRGLTGALSVSTGGGDVHVTDVSGAVNVSTGGGNVTIGQLSGLVSVRTGGGDISGTVTSRVVTAVTGGGNIRLTFTNVPRNLDITTSGGDVTIIVPPGHYDVNAHTDGGTVNDQLSIDTSSPDKIRTSTGGGNITLLQAA